jgi:tetraacyldisaccharide 4'-kinase
MILNTQEIEASWYGGVRLGSFQRGLLLVLSWLYGLATAGRRRLYACGLLKRTRLAVPVIVVGNLIIGGAGKTPLTRMLAQQLRAAGWRPGIVSRGYGRTLPGVRAVGRGDNPRHVGDEPLLYAADDFPVYVGEKRVAAAQALLAANPAVDIVIADDGLQHYALERDIEVVVFDQRGAGNGQLLPAGPLREGLHRLHNPKIRARVWQGEVQPLAGISESDQSSYVMTLVPGLVYALNDPSRTCALADFAGQTVCAVAGIGHPERFFQMLREHGIRVVEYAFPDHHPYTGDDLPSAAMPVLMTEKDAVKCQEFSAGHDYWFVVPVAAQVDPPLPLTEWLEASA